MIYDSQFSLLLHTALKKYTTRKELRFALKNLQSYALTTANPLSVFRVALELNYLGLSTKKLEKFIISCNDPIYIFRFANGIKNANIKKLQAAMASCCNILQLAKFACAIKGADTKSIEEYVIKSKNAKAAYLLLRYVKSSNIEELKPLIINSRKPRYLFYLAQLLTDQKELSIIENIILNCDSFMYMRLFAIHIKNANFKKFEDKIIASGNINEMKKLYASGKSERMKKIALLF